MVASTRRSTSFITLDLDEPLAELLERLRRLRRGASYVVVGLGGGKEPSFCVWERAPFAAELARFAERLEVERPAGAASGLEVTLGQVLGPELSQLQRARTLRARQRSVFVGPLEVAVELAGNKPAAIFVPVRRGLKGGGVEPPAILTPPALSTLFALELTKARKVSSPRSAAKAASPPVHRGSGRHPVRREIRRGGGTRTVAGGGSGFDNDPSEPIKTGFGVSDVDAGWGGPERGAPDPSPATKSDKVRRKMLMDVYIEPHHPVYRSFVQGGRSPDQERKPVFPEIKVSNQHPLQGRMLKVSVALGFERHEATAGEATLPADEVERAVEVHLLFGERSYWGQLRFKRPEGTTKKAVFAAVEVPKLLPDQDDTVPDSRLADLVVNFYLDGRWCGEAVRRIEIRARKSVEPLAAIPAHETLPWREHLHLAPGAPPPDLLVRIERLDDRSFRWSLLSPHRSFAAIPDADLTTYLGAMPHAFVRQHFEIFTSTALDDALVKELWSKCNLIYSITPEGFRKAYWDLYLAAQQQGSRVKLDTIQFVSDEPFIPWELMRVADDKRAPDLAPEILSIRHAVGRWLAGESSQLRQSLVVEEIAVFATDYATVARITRKLKWALEELKNLVQRFRATKHAVLTSEVLTFLEQGAAQLIHFSCHGKANAQETENATLEMEDKELTAPLVYGPEARRGVGRQRPLVFLNACQAGTGGEVLGMVFGWPQAFVRMGATACVAPLWSVVDETAKDVAAAFYEAVLKDRGADPAAQPQTIGEALRVIRGQWREKKSLTYLGYVLYGDPTARLEWRPRPSAPAGGDGP